MSGIYSGLIVAIVVLLFGPYARFIPKAALAGLLFVTAARLIDWKRLGYALRASWFDAALVLVTALSAIFISVDESILIGVGLSIVMFVPRASKLSTRELIVTPERIVREIQPQDQPSNFVRIYDLEGELFFGAAPELDQTLEDIKKSSIQFNIKYLVLRFRRTRNPDVVAIEHLEHFLRDAEKNGITVFLAGVRPDLAKILKNTGLLSLLGKDRIYFEDDEQYSATIKAVRHVYKLFEQKNSEYETTNDTNESIYYLV
jgi:SulP family sulfate permease